METSKSLSCENNNSTLFSAVPDSSNMYSNKDSNLISENSLTFGHAVSQFLHGEIPKKGCVPILQNYLSKIDGYDYMPR